MNKPLAIIIPAYKPDFLDKALVSICQQTNKDFNLYIGDDCSPYDLEAIVFKYSKYHNITYNRFDTNLGGSNLVSQWKRCIEMAKDEKWIWLFSDDDIMTPDCVQRFYDELKTTDSKYDIYHFNVQTINENGDPISKVCKYRDIYHSFDFYRDKMNGSIISLVVENIFSREVYNRTNGFQSFDLAWGSDTASWVKFMHTTGMKTINDGLVFWRCSDKNISPNTSEAISVRKVYALMDYYCWAYNFFDNQGFSFALFNLKTYVQRMLGFRKHIKWQIVLNCNKKFCEIFHISFLRPFIDLYIKFR